MICSHDVVAPRLYTTLRGWQAQRWLGVVQQEGSIKIGESARKYAKILQQNPAVLQSANCQNRNTLFGIV
jgi:hypothetical protein